VTMAGNREPLEKLLQEMVGGNLRAAIDRLKDRAQLSLPELAAKCREGRDSLIQHFGFAQGSADRIASTNPELFMRIEELELAPTTKIELNTAPDGEPPSWHALEELSTGQKATAVLLLLLLESKLHSSWINPKMIWTTASSPMAWSRSCGRKNGAGSFVFSTHNANIPVLGDAELIIGLTASGEAKDGVARIPSDHMASIDVRPVREMVDEILEGGKEAFEMRRLKYGF
jgi:hypothetical protein